MQREVGEHQVYGSWIDRYDASNVARRHVVKVHDANEPLAWRARCVLTSRRDLRDIAASAWKRNWIGDAASALAFLDSVVAQHAFWKARAAHEMTYEAMRRDPRKELASIAAALELKLDDNAIDATLTAIDSLSHDDSSEDDFNPSNLMHKQHIMDGRVGYHAETLPAELLAAINDRYREWLRTNGYAA